MSRELDDIYSALQSGLEAANTMRGMANHWRYREAADQCIGSLNDGMAAYHKLSRDLRDGRKHIETPDDFKHTECYCSAPTCSPPCSWCTEGKEREEEEEFFHPNDD